MKKYRWVLTAVFAAFLVGTSGCGKKTETIPITTISQSTDDDDPKDNLAASGDSDEIPEYDVDLSKNLNSFQLAIWGDTYEIPESYADFTALGWVYSGDDTKEIQPESFSEGESFVNFIPPEGDAEQVVGISQINIHRVALDSEIATVQVDIIADIQTVYQTT